MADPSHKSFMRLLFAPLQFLDILVADRVPLKVLHRDALPAPQPHLEGKFADAIQGDQVLQLQLLIQLISRDLNFSQLLHTFTEPVLIVACVVILFHAAEAEKLH